MANWVVSSPEFAGTPEKACRDRGFESLEIESVRPMTGNTTNGGAEEEFAYMDRDSVASVAGYLNEHLLSDADSAVFPSVLTIPKDVIEGKEGGRWYVFSDREVLRNQS
jgi:hypothetical protein